MFSTKKCNYVNTLICLTNNITIHQNITLLPINMCNFVDVTFSGLELKRNGWKVWKGPESRAVPGTFSPCSEIPCFFTELCLG